MEMNNPQETKKCIDCLFSTQIDAFGDNDFFCNFILKHINENSYKSEICSNFVDYMDHIEGFINELH